MAACLDNVLVDPFVISTVGSTAEEEDGCLGMGLSVEECDEVAAVLAPAWARNATALADVRAALAAGRPVHIQGGAFQVGLANEMQVKNVDFLLKCSDFVLKYSDFVPKMLGFVLKMLDCAG